MRVRNYTEFLLMLDNGVVVMLKEALTFRNAH